MRELPFLQAPQESGEDARRLARVRARGQVLDKRPLDDRFPRELPDHLFHVVVARPEGLFAKAKVLGIRLGGELDGLYFGVGSIARGDVVPTLEASTSSNSEGVVIFNKIKGR